MAEGAQQAIANIATTATAYFPAILGVVATLQGMRAVLNFIRSAG